MQIDNIFKVYNDSISYGSSLTLGLSKYMSDFMEPSLNTQWAFMEAEWNKLQQKSAGNDSGSFLELLQLNNDLTHRAMKSSMETIIDYQQRFQNEGISAWQNTLYNNEKEGLADFFQRRKESAEVVLNSLPQAIRDIKAEYGFHFGDGGNVRIDETDRFVLYQVLPLKKEVKTNPDGKPVLIIPPYVLGPNILSFLPGEQRSYVHSFADQGVPTYIRIVKDINTHPAVQTMTGEDDALDTRRFCELLKTKHENAVTLNGFCQGGYIALCTLLSGELDDFVDSLITCVAPMDGTRSPSFVNFMDGIPPSYKGLEYAMKTLPNGNRVIDGKIMSWVYRLKSIEVENPVTKYFQDLAIYGRTKDPVISKIASAINYWLTYDRTDLPVAITKMSYDSYTRPVDKEGNLPVTLFGRTLNFKHIMDKNIHFLIAYAENDDLITKESAMAPLDYIEAEVTIYPKGHGGIATSWSVPTSECAHHTCFLGESGRRKLRGIVRYHLDLEEGLIQAKQRREVFDRRETRTYTCYDSDELPGDNIPLPGGSQSGN
jgi:poly(3-hydroxyalkanoate) synthetase